MTHPKVKTHPRQLWFFSQFLGSFFPLSICLFLAISPTLSPPPKNQRHQDQNLRKSEFWMLRENLRFFFCWQNPSLLYFQSQYTTELEKSKAWRNKNQLKYLTLNRSSHSVIKCVGSSIAQINKNYTINYAVKQSLKTIGKKW